MKAIVLYRSISGFTKKYAEWIAEELGAELFDCRYVKPEMLAAYDIVIFGGSLHAVGINGIDVIKRNLGMLAGKKIIIFATGASPSREDIPEEVIAANFSAEERKLLRFFYLRGGFDFDKLNFPNKVLMTLLKWKLKLTKSDALSSDEKGMLAAYDRPMDFTKRASIGALLDCARSTGSGFST